MYHCVSNESMCEAYRSRMFHSVGISFTHISCYSTHLPAAFAAEWAIVWLSLRPRARECVGRWFSAHMGTFSDQRVSCEPFHAYTFHCAQQDYLHFTNCTPPNTSELVMPYSALYDKDIDYIGSFFFCLFRFGSYAYCFRLEIHVAQGHVWSVARHRFGHN